jgi:hypothetical protein
MAMAGLFAIGCRSQGKTATTGGLIGLFKITAGECAGATPSGSFFRMVQTGGNPSSGPFVRNGDSPCEDKTWTSLLPGADGGLVTGAYQEQPDPPFKTEGPSTNAVANRIAQPQSWFAVKFALATNSKDPQTGLGVAVPSITNSGGKLSGDLRAFAAAWNGQHFNQGSPKPDGSKPGNTSGPTGTYDDGSRKFTLDWTSQIVGGPFNNFTGKWHLEGVFEPKS